ncbi:hypothetical protein G6F57_013406 [Rhizopus arrhizus]|uniref:Uncharacterized protein n=1 Tax=Rhizopus oryzae TaxID=64495 RepID=A0A9P6WYM1_RHIOR|nr:hypothetical protein G6F23_010721 [Rhizopus arrhizus]KAG1397391.1 hypothetical protein G6F58_011538 [Rhizopus delemar]KAG0755028.1 hypothetical protein G6F24_012107 [Rhizopus arrhizus]KAG0780834.1 hypothetical protein G6F21_011950 [Rhizopus arrhizus]KAG0784855.1 hypothetical protein G6F22_008159 [Rhizopus arrhizus]
MPYNVDQIVYEIRNYRRTVDAFRSEFRSEFQAWKDEVWQQMTGLKLMIERNAPTSYHASQAAIYQSQLPQLNLPAFEIVRRDVPRFPASLGDGRHSNAACIDAFLRETMDLVDKPEDSDETLDQKTFLAKRYHSQLNRFTQVVCTSSSNKLLADAHIDKNKLTWKDIPAVYKNVAYTELEELALRANISLNRCNNSWGAQVLLAKSYNNYYNKKLKNQQQDTANNVVEPNTYVTEQIDDTHPEERFGLELLPNLDASNELEEGNSNEISMYSVLSRKNKKD